MQRKVLYVITKSNWGGAQRYVFDLATRLSKAEFEAVVALGGTGEKGAQTGLLAQRLKDNGIRTVFIESFMRDVSVNKEFAAYRELIRIFKQERPDVVHLNSSKAGGLGALAARVSGVRKIVFTAHGWPFRESRNPVSKIALWLLSYATALLSTDVICVSEFDLKQAKKMPGVHAVRIYNGIEPLSLGTGEKIRSAFPAGAKITGTVGELVKNKNQIALVEEAKKDASMHVAIVGEGEERKNLKRKIKEYDLEDRVKLFGFMPAADVLKGFDVFALPSIKEGLPYVLLEAKAAGLPIMANRTGGVGEILDAKDMSDFELARMINRTIGVYS
jgi:glycosyltransferase involved in cell wall biosynthesis